MQALRLLCMPFFYFSQLVVYILNVEHVWQQEDGNRFSSPSINVLRTSNYGLPFIVFWL